MSSDSKQLQIDFARGEQLFLLREARVPDLRALEGAGSVVVSSTTARAVLRAIDDHGRGRACWAAAATLARVAGCSVRSVRRAVKALEGAGVICTVPRRSPAGAVCNHYTVVWSELALLVSAGTSPAKCHHGTPVASTGTDQSAMVTKRSAMVALAECHGGTQTAKEPQLKTASSQAEAGGGVFVLALDQDDGDPSWASVGTAIRGIGLARVNQAISAAQAAGLGPREVLGLLEAYRSQRTRLQGPGAFFERLRSGCWPVDGVRDVARRAAPQVPPVEASFVGEAPEPDLDPLWGPVLDGLSDTDLSARVAGTENGRLGLVLGRQSAFGREFLLRAVMETER